MADEVAAQNNDVADQPQAVKSDDTLDSFLGEADAVDKQGETPDLSPEAKEAKKERDFEAGMHKFRDEAKRLKAENAELKAKLPPPLAGQEGERVGQPDLANDPGVKILRGIIREEVDSAIAPVAESTREEREAKVWTDFQSKEHVNALLPQIQETYASMSKSGNLANDLENARLITVGRFHKEITRAAAEVGEEAGFAGRTLKQSQAGITSRPADAGAKDDFAARYKSGTATTEEIKERMDEVEQIEKEERNNAI